MILVAVAKGPNGENPGIFLASAGALHHVASMADVAAYQKAGVPGPVTISFADYQNYVAEEKARVPVIPATVTTITPEEITTAVETAFQAEASKIATLPMP